MTNLGYEPYPFRAPLPHVGLEAFLAVSEKMREDPTIFENTFDRLALEQSNLVAAIGVAIKKYSAEFPEGVETSMKTAMVLTYLLVEQQAIIDQKAPIQELG